MQIDKETARILSCDISIRPIDAAGISELLPHVRQVQRGLDSITISLDVAGSELLNSFVEAERLCCSGLTWSLQEDDELIHLRIAGTSDQLDTIVSWFDVK